MGLKKKAPLDCLLKRQLIEVEETKIQMIEKLQPPNLVKGIRSFLGYIGFYRRFIQEFSKITKSLCNLLEKDIPFNFFDECLTDLNTLKEKLTSVPVIVAPDWELPFELMCDAFCSKGTARSMQGENIAYYLLY